MYCDVPVITSNTTSLPEVAGEAAILVDPNSVSDIANAMCDIFTDKNLHAQLIQKSQLRKKEFSWNRTASLFWNSIQKLMNENPKI
jgi:glycosyltransferase involved in cell wall biosynthesis